MKSQFEFQRNKIEELTNEMDSYDGDKTVLALISTVIWLFDYCNGLEDEIVELKRYTRLIEKDVDALQEAAY